MSIRISVCREQGADNGSHPPGWNRAAAQPELRRAHQFPHLGSGLRMQRGGRAYRVGNTGDKNLLDVGVVCVLEEHDGRIYIFRQLLSADRNSAGVLQSSEQKKLLLVENRNAGGARVYFNHQSPSI